MKIELELHIVSPIEKPSKIRKLVKRWPWADKSPFVKKDLIPHSGDVCEMLEIIPQTKHRRQCWRVSFVSNVKVFYDRRIIHITADSESLTISGPGLCHAQEKEFKCHPIALRSSFHALTTHGWEEVI